MSVLLYHSAEGRLPVIHEYHTSGYNMSQFVTHHKKNSGCNSDSVEQCFKFNVWAGLKLPDAQLIHFDFLHIVV